MVRVVILVAILLTAGAVTVCAQELKPDSTGSVPGIDARAMIADGRSAFLATRGEVYRAVQDIWREVFTLPAGENEIRCLAGGSKGLFVGTKRGLYRSGDGGRSWRNVFRTITPEKSDVYAVYVSQGETAGILLGTGRGIFVSDDGGQRWRDISGTLKNKSVRSVALDRGYAYAGTDDGLYVSHDGQYAWIRAYVETGAADDEGEADASSEPDEAEEASSGGVACIAISGERVYIGSGKRVLYSDDRGRAWRSFPAEGLAGVLTDILVTAKSGRIFCATTRGVFAYAQDGQRWDPLYKGTDRTLAARKVVLGESEASVWALSDTGLYRLDAAPDISDNYIDVERNTVALNLLRDDEPDFAELRQAALRYNEVGPEKIAHWRQQSRLKALLPRVSVGLDHDRSNTYEIYTSASKDYAVTGPDDISDGWDVSFSWDLGDLMWSTDQTSIDVRSRLNTQLRNDVLDDLRRAYFERKRLLFELMHNPAKDAKAQFEKELRIEELTQAIDDLTGNYLTEHRSKMSYLPDEGTRVGTPR